MVEIAHNKFVSVEERAKSAGDICEQISSFLIESVHYIVDTGVNICQQWLKNVEKNVVKNEKSRLERNSDKNVADSKCCYLL